MPLQFQTLVILSLCSEPLFRCQMWISIPVVDWVMAADGGAGGANRGSFGRWRHPENPLTRKKVRVWWKGITRASQALVEGSIPSTRSKFYMIKTNIYEANWLIFWKIEKDETGTSGALFALESQTNLQTIFWNPELLYSCWDRTPPNNPHPSMRIAAWGGLSSF